MDKVARITFDLFKGMMIMESELAKRKADFVSAEPVFAAAESL